ncbi:GNAT family N-acetyltransferase [Zhongshania sp.]|uniref:GNAT family N-acetyltransferase n=1 Tax=Zhongshania sp. TaxID=1971902 RepID=UPI002A808932|nr:GNAT family N-acetyltransferase [Zhongshania sp.]
MNLLFENDSALSLADVYERLRSQALHSGHRYLVFVSGSAAWCETQLLNVPTALDNCLLVARHELCGLTPCKTENTLGSEYSSLLINAHNHQKLNDWLAAAGCLTAGGVLLLLCPRFSEWPGHFSNQSHFGDSRPSVFMQRLLRLAAGLEGCFFWDQETGCSGNAPNTGDKWQQTLPTPSQTATLAAIKTVVTGRAKRPLVIRSDRGRGKTSVLGLAVAALFASEDNDCRRVLITAPSFAAVKGAFEHLAAVLPAAQWRDDSCFVGPCCFTFLAFDAALKNRDDWDLLLVDEAAALPVAGLRTLLLRYPRIVFSSTVHGYEGSGRGFDIRFKAILDAERPQWRRQNLDEPIRWAADDPLEHALNALFLLNAEPRPSDDNRDELTVRVVDCEALCDDDLLRQVFGLLVQAHYQTTPQDLQYLLDGDAVIIIASRGSSVLGVCQLLPEGGFAEGLAAEVIKGRRRPAGHLAAQRLAHCSAESRYLTGQSWRINRIAVAADWRRQGLGRAMLTTAEHVARSRNITYLSSSFAADPQVINFWLAQGFAPTYFGSRRDSASGLYSLIVVKGLSPQLEADAARLASQLNNDLRFSLASVYAGLSADLLIVLLASTRNPASLVPTSAVVVAKRYCDGELIFEQAAASLAQLCLVCDLRAVSDADLAVARLLLGHNWTGIADQFGLTGKAEIELNLKRIFKQLISTLV